MDDWLSDSGTRDERLRFASGSIAMKLSRIGRRDFIESMLLVGLTACAGPRAASRALRASPGDRAIGPLFDELAVLSDDLIRGRITGPGFARRADARLMELELETDVLADWHRQGPTDPGIGHNGTRILDSRDLAAGGRSGAIKAILFYTP